MNTYELKQETKRERYAALATKKRKEGQAFSERGREALSAIPFGQPILIGHHSERRDRSYRSKAVGLIEKGFRTNDVANYYEEKAEAVGTAGISSDDPDALAKLKTKLEGLEARHASIKKAGATMRANGESVPGWMLTNNAANIRSTKKRIAELEAKQTMALRPDIVGNGYTITEDRDENRIKVLFTGIPSVEIRCLLKSKGFRWSPTSKAWQIGLMGRGRYNVDCMLNKLNELSA